jgi:penicillin-binding protein 1A
MILLGLVLLVVTWLAVTAPLHKSLQPVVAPSITLLSAEGVPIARRGATILAPVDVTKLPPYVGRAFVAIEDRRFYTHIGVDPWGIARALIKNTRSGGVRQGGSTITQQLAKLSFLTPERTATRKIQEATIALWLELWLSKEDILSRYLSNVYFGDNVYGLRAAAWHYFSKKPEQLTRSEAAMLAGIVNAPSRLAPTSNLQGARDREALVIAAMAQTGKLSAREVAAIRPARANVAWVRNIPTGTYFADWVWPQARTGVRDPYGAREVQTTLEAPLQRLAERVVRNAGVGNAQVALVAMRPDGRVVAMVGGKDYAKSPFNRATQARRQPGSTFKLFVYLAALRTGFTPDDMVDDKPLTIGDWSPKNYGGQYRGRITLREAFAVSSNVAAVRMSEKVGRASVIRAARDLGIASPLDDRPSLPLGTSGVTLLELTSAYAAFAANSYPVTPRGLPEVRTSWFQRFWSNRTSFEQPISERMLDLLSAAANEGTGRAAALRVPTYGKTGTSQDYRDALFVGFAGDLITGVWIGNDDNQPLAQVAGGGLPARIWRNFMIAAVNSEPGTRKPAPQLPQPVVVPDDAYFEPEPSMEPEQEPAQEGQEGDDEGFDVQLTRPPRGPNDEVEAIVVPRLPQPGQENSRPPNGEQ